MEENIKVRNTELLGKWLWMLFLLVIPSIIASIMTNDTIVGVIPWLKVPGMIIDLICSVAYGWILLKLASECEYYRKSGIWYLVVAAINVIMVLITLFNQEVAWVVILSIPATLIALYAEYHEFKGHAEVVRDNDVDFYRDLSDKWDTLFKWYFGSYIAIVGATIFSVILPVIGALVVLAAILVLLVTSILKLVYLYKTSKLFQTYGI